MGRSFAQQVGRFGLVAFAAGHARGWPLLLYGTLCVCAGVTTYLAGILMVFPRYLLDLDSVLLRFDEAVVWFSGVPIMAGFCLIGLDLAFLFPLKRVRCGIENRPLHCADITVALTACDDEDSIAAVVADFLDHPNVRRVLVVSNGSADRTVANAEAAGALTFSEERRGYGRCVHRCLTEAVRFAGTDLIVLCEGDRTFRAQDLDKFLAYAPHADIVNGTRTIERLRQFDTQLSTFIYYGNLFTGKLLEAKHLGKATITDMGTTYKLCRRDALLALLPRLDGGINLEFNAHFLDMALSTGLSVVECPVTFHKRVGLSKGGNVNNLRALAVGCRMIVGVVAGWSRLRAGA